MPEEKGTVAAKQAPFAPAATPVKLINPEVHGDFVVMMFPKRVLLTKQDGSMVQFDAGPRKVPRIIDSYEHPVTHQLVQVLAVDHWYLKAHGVSVFTDDQVSTMTISDRKKEAIEYVKSKGYNDFHANNIVENEGVISILKAKAAEAEEEAEKDRQAGEGGDQQQAAPQITQNADDGKQTDEAPAASATPIVDKAKKAKAATDKAAETKQ